MTVKIASDVYKLIQHEALNTPDVEVCGLLIGSDASQIEAAIPVANISDRPNTRFEIATDILFKLQRDARASGKRLIGHYHSHPHGQPVPSSCDAQNAHELGALWVIVGKGGQLGFFRAVKQGSIEGRFVELTPELV